MHSDIIERDGLLYVLDPWLFDWQRPVRYRTAWPTGLRAVDYPELVGTRATDVGDGHYRLEDGRLLSLERGGQTRPAPEHCVEEKIPRPRGRREYRNGRWQR